MVELDRIPTLDVIDTMITYTEQRIAVEPNPLGVHLLKHHLKTYYKMADMILNNVLEES